LANDLKEVAGIDVQHRQPGGLVFCLGDSESEARTRTIRRLHNQTDTHEIEMIDRTRVETLLPGLRLGCEVTGASFCPHDGHVNPLLLLRGLHAALKRLGVAYRPDAPARVVSWERGVFVVQTPAGRFEAGKLVLAAGHGIPVLARSLGLAAPIVVERGQIMITERVAPFMPLPALEFRQTGDGTVQIGATHERVGYNLSTTPRGAARFVDRAVRVLPSLASVQVARVWAGLRVLTPDGCPAYMQSETCPGSFVAICHSGVTLAAAHAADLAAAIVAGALPDSFTPFHPRRFDVPQSA